MLIAHTSGTPLHYINSLHYFDTKQIKAILGVEPDVFIRDLCQRTHEFINTETLYSPIVKCGYDTVTVLYPWFTVVAITNDHNPKGTNEFLDWILKFNPAHPESWEELD